MSEATAESLAADKQWLDLLHYHQIGLFSSFESQADDAQFFLAPDGKTNPYSELLATIKAFSEQQIDGKPSVQCKFPARLFWLKEKLGYDFFPVHQCKEFDDWFNKIDADALTLIFPAAYLNSPSSMFGHTLIRIDRKSGKNPLLDYSVNYAANADPDDNELVFSYKGLSGGYPGVFSILPYYQKVKEYSFLEARDVWEYELELSQDEVNQFVRHAWEIQNTYFDYYFFDENCSYHLLTILDAASPRLHFSDQFKITAIPADTVREIGSSGLIKSATFRPSTLSLMSDMLRQVKPELTAIAKNLTAPDIDIDAQIQNLSIAAKAQTLELAYQYTRYLSVRKKQQSKDLNQRSIALLSSRSKLPINSAFKSYPEPEFRDDQGHLSKRLETRFGVDNHNNFAQIGLRMAYHDLLDPIPGYIKGGKLEMFHLQLRHNFEHHKTQIQSLRLIDIESLSPRNALITPVSWQVSTGLKRFKSKEDELTAYLTSGAGLSYYYKDQLFYTLLKGELNIDNNIQKGHRIALGPRIGWLSQHDNWSANLEFNILQDVLGAKFKERNALFGLSYALTKNWQLRVTSDYQRYYATELNKIKHDQVNAIALMHFF